MNSLTTSASGAAGSRQSWRRSSGKPGCALLLYGVAGLREPMAGFIAGSQNRSAGLERKGAEAYLTYHNGIYATGLNEGRLTKETVTETSGDIQFRQDTIDEVNTTLKKY
ncbi:hypothetical protein [Klebsiella grimontii]|uniref:hypothetical protein n=1 Tax=Klebsiella grimontii TaxID=2058152 RepID=UPI001D0F3833|nr:hypothetical protein [Klebsiella grimontii]